LVEEWNGLYREGDGQKAMRLICPTAPCTHGPHGFHRYEIVRRIPPKWFGLIHDGGAEFKCVRCGHKRTDLDYSM
jgi:hypothetical protein